MDPPVDTRNNEADGAVTISTCPTPAATTICSSHPDDGWDCGENLQCREPVQQGRPRQTVQRPGVRRRRSMAFTTIAAQRKLIGRTASLVVAQWLGDLQRCRPRRRGADDHGRPSQAATRSSAGLQHRSRCEPRLLASRSCTAHGRALIAPDRAFVAMHPVSGTSLPRRRVTSSSTGQRSRPIAICTAAFARHERLRPCRDDDPWALRIYAGFCRWTLARAHARSATPSRWPVPRNPNDLDQPWPTSRSDTRMKTIWTTSRSVRRSVREAVTTAGCGRVGPAGRPKHLQCRHVASAGTRLDESRGTPRHPGL